MDLNMIKSKLGSLQSQSSKGKGEKIDYTKIYWKPKQEGKTQVRIIPSKFNKEWPFKEVQLHYGFSKFAIYSLSNWGEADPIVEFAKKLRETNESDNWSLAKKIDPKMRIFAQVIVRGEEDKGVRLWEFGKNIYQSLLSLADDPDYGDYTDINEGIDFTIEAKYGDVGGRKVLLTSITPKRKSSVLSKDADEIKGWLEDQNDILELQGRYKKSYDDIKALLANFINPEEEEEEGAIIAEKSSDFDKDTTTDPKSNYSLSKKDTKAPVDKFDSLFDEKKDKDEDEDDLPF
jgi:hypothetical protein|tara:strand:- start:26 stop:892 length:867 start_codon:yes stop_codon:yes gene_type:complete